MIKPVPHPLLLSLRIEIKEEATVSILLSTRFTYADERYLLDSSTA
jgi:hypothetical protein